MKIAYFDTISGISGDMTLGAFISAGVAVDKLISELQKLQLSGFEISSRHITRNGIVATKIDVVISHQPHYHRHWNDIKELIEKSTLSTVVKERAKRIFYEVAVAEAKVHNTSIEKIHFHEVGAIDSLVDIVGTSICLEELGIQDIYSSPIKVGNGGTVHSQHGQLPIPTPATMEILKNYPILLTDVPYELTTPTGAAIIKALSQGVLSTERMKVSAIGYGAGDREIEQLPNILRILIGELEQEHQGEEIISIETNIDNMNPEIHPYIIEKLLAAGVNDAYLIPLIMKKGRPGVMLNVLVERGKSDRALEIIFQETTTLGVRIQPVGRIKLPRSQKEVSTSLGIISVKVVTIDGREQLRPEFEECKRIAFEKNLPLLEVYNILERELHK